MPQETSQILLIDEDPTMAAITGFRLELLGYEVITKESADQALTWLQQERPNLIIIDQFLTDIDGLELVNRLSNDMRLSDIPVIFMSSNADLDDVQKAYNAGADDYLVTPFDPAVLESKVLRMISTTQEV